MKLRIGPVSTDMQQVLNLLKEWANIEPYSSAINNLHNFAYCGSKSAVVAQIHEVSNSRVVGNSVIEIGGSRREEEERVQKKKKKRRNGSTRISKK